MMNNIIYVCFVNMGILWKIICVFLWGKTVRSFGVFVLDVRNVRMGGMLGLMGCVMWTRIVVRLLMKEDFAKNVLKATNSTKKINANLHQPVNQPKRIINKHKLPQTHLHRNPNLNPSLKTKMNLFPITYKTVWCKMT